MNRRPSVRPEDYSAYLQGRSRIGAVYRHYLLYPRLVRHLTGSVLDFGCGIGDFLRFYPLAKGVDINEYNIRYCRDMGLDAHLIRDGSIPFPDATFDSVMMDNVLEHVPAVDVDAVLAEISRVLRPSGILLIGVPGVKGYAADADHKVFYDDQALCRLMQLQGYDCRALFHMPLPFTFLGRVLRQYCVYGVFEKKQ